MEAIIPVQVKWGKEKFEVELNLGGTMADFRAALYSLTFVPVQNQKILFKGKTLKDETNLSDLKVKAKSLFMLMGAAEGMSIEDQAKDQKKTVFLEELSEKQIAELYKEKTGFAMPVGLVNCGNTCYLNSCIQCLKRINELKQYFVDNKPNDMSSADKMVSTEFGRLMNQMESAGQPVKPLQFIQALFQVQPQFAQRDGPAFKQQDADECYMAISQCLENNTPYQNIEGEKSQLMKDLFEIEYEVTFKNTDLPDEPPSVRQDISKKLMCQIENESTPTNHLLDGITLSLDEKLEKLSEVDNQNHIYTKTSRIAKLPSYLAVQMGRFLWKDAVQVASTQAGKVKILRQVSFPKILDVYSLCTDELKKSLDYGREFEAKMKEQQDEKNKNKFDLWKQEQEEKGVKLPDDSKILWKQFKEQQKEKDIKEHDHNLYRPHGQGLDAGQYQLVAVLTHQGRSSDSGHYISWIHRSGDSWLQYDDDKVSEKQLENIMELKGGGDWHMGYYLFYRKLELVQED